MNELINYKINEISEVFIGGDCPLDCSAEKTRELSVPIFSNGLEKDGLYGYTKTPRIPGDTITISARGVNIGTVFYRKEPFYPIVRLISLVPDNVKVNSKYLYYNLKINSIFGSGSAQPQVTAPQIKRTKILCFKDVEYQIKIANILSNYDDLIENNIKRIAFLEQMAETLYKEWFVCFRFPKHETVAFENGFPKGFEYKTVDQLSDVLQRGISPTYDDNGKYYVISQKCIRKNIMDISEARKQSKEYKPILNLKDGDTVICSTGTGTLGRVGQVYGDYPDTTFDSHVTLVRAKNNIGKHFLFYSLKNLQPWFMNMGIGSTNQQELYKKTIQKAKIFVPDTALMNSFEEYIEQIHKQIIALSKANNNLIKQRDLLLPRLMSGTLKV